MYLILKAFHQNVTLNIKIQCSNNVSQGLAHQGKTEKKTNAPAKSRISYKLKLLI